MWGDCLNVRNDDLSLSFFQWSVGGANVSGIIINYAGHNMLHLYRYQGVKE